MIDANLILDAASKQNNWRYCTYITGWSDVNPRTDVITATSSNGLTFRIYSPYDSGSALNTLVLEDEQGILFNEKGVGISSKDIASKIHRVYLSGVETIEKNAKSKLEQLLSQANSEGN